MIFRIAGRELRSLFVSPLAWVVLAVLTLILAFLFVVYVDLFVAGQSQMLGMDSGRGLTEGVAAPLFNNAAFILLLVVPLITMRLIADERRNRTLSLLFSAPVSMTEIVLGKYLGVLAFFGVVILIVAAMPLSLLAGGGLDMGLFASALLGLALIVAAFAAVGLFMSSLTQSATIAAVSSFGALLLLWVLDWSGEASTQGKALLSYLSLLNHYEPFMRGVFDSADAAYYLLFIVLFLGLTVRRLDADRVGA